jgi:hypothetical protein
MGACLILFPRARIVLFFPILFARERYVASRFRGLKATRPPSAGPQR